jgi:hypothetical protein
MLSITWCYPGVDDLLTIAGFSRLRPAVAFANAGFFDPWPRPATFLISTRQYVRDVHCLQLDIFMPNISFYMHEAGHIG